MKDFSVVKKFVMILFTFFAFTSSQPPSTDIYLMDVKITKRKVLVDNLKNITNRDGYDNHPSFTPEGDGLYYSSIKDTQSDIYYYSLKDQSIQQITHTPESEFAPTVMPGHTFFSSVLIEMDKTQRLWKFDRMGNNASLVFPDLTGIGYHAWVDANTVTFFVLEGEEKNPSFVFYIVDVPSGKRVKIGENIGRTFKNVYGENSVLFVQKKEDEDWWIQKIDMKTHLITSIIKTLNQQEDFEILADNSLLMGKDGILFRFKMNKDKEWKKMVDFKKKGIDAFDRLAISPDGMNLAIVTPIKNKTDKQ